MPAEGDPTLALLTVAELPRVGERRLQRVQERARQQALPLARLADLPAATLRDQFELPIAAIERLAGARLARRALRRAGEPVVRAPGWRLRARRSRLSGWLGAPRRPPPPLAYLHGNRGLLGQPLVALLHSRTVDAGTVAATARIARAAVDAGYGLAVGGMKTTHRIAAVTARALGAARVVVLDRGLLAAFGGDLDRDPFGFGPRRARFDATRTLVATPFRCEDHAVPRSGRRRDALLAALADLIVAVQARPGGEIERLCLRALQRGQRVAVWRDHNRRLLTAGTVPLPDDRLGEWLRGGGPLRPA
ncbi:MAG: hypothetical protein U0802_11205 [Candidatus Binatia bacterium]